MVYSTHYEVNNAILSTGPRRLCLAFHFRRERVLIKGGGVELCGVIRSVLQRDLRNRKHQQAHTDNANVIRTFSMLNKWGLLKLEYIGTKSEKSGVTTPQGIVAGASPL